MHLRQPGFVYKACGPFTKKNNDYNKLRKKEIHDILIKTNYKKPSFSITWLMKILKTYLEEQVLIKY